jgi:hypothetical protein
MPLLALRRQLSFAGGLLGFSVSQSLELAKAGGSVRWLAHLIGRQLVSSVFADPYCFGTGEKQPAAKNGPQRKAAGELGRLDMVWVEGPPQA